MTSYEIVRRAVEFDSPSRIPVRFGSMGIDDTYGVGFAPGAGWQPSVENEDEWGCVWHKPTGDICNMGQPKGHPLAQWAELPHIHFPDPHDPRRLAGLPGQSGRRRARAARAGGTECHEFRPSSGGAKLDRVAGGELLQRLAHNPPRRRRRRER